MRPPSPEATYCEMALTAAFTVLGDASELCDIRIEHTLMLDEETPLGAVVASLQGPGVLAFAVETLNDGKHTRWATAVLRAVRRRGSTARRCKSPISWRHIPAGWTVRRFDSGSNWRGLRIRSRLLQA